MALAALLAVVQALVLPVPAAVAAPEGPGPPVVVRGGGWGHSVGMSQYGAFAQALAGRAHPDILRSYYPGVGVGRDARVPAEIRVGLLREQTSVLVRTSSRNGDAPARPVSVDLGAGPVDVPWGGSSGPLDYAVRRGGPGFVLVDEHGALKGEGPGPVTVHFEHLDANPTLLRLPQLLAAGDRGAPEPALAAAGKRAATYQWGRLEISDMGGDRLRAVLVAPLERYLRGLAEMPSGWHGEALRAQAVAGRTYATRRVATTDAGAQPCGCHLGATSLDQVYSGWAKEGEPTFGRAWVAAVDGTDGVVVTSGGSLAQTVYSSSHGGRTENSQDSWAFSTPFPYLVSVDDPWSLDPAVKNPYASWSATFDNRRFADVVAPDLAVLTGVRVVGERTAGGTPGELEISGRDGAGQVHGRRFTGGPKASAGANLKLALLADLRSQQIRSIGFPPFADDDGSLHEYNVWAIAGKGVTAGCDGGDAERFCPNDTITRGQMATFLAKALGLPAGGSGGFDDIGGSVHRGAIEAIAGEGITTGCGERRFCPDDTVTRGQMATFLTAAFALPAGEASFSDAAGSVHASGIGAVSKAGITTGCGGDRYCPGEPVVRAQMATFLARASGYGA